MWGTSNPQFALQVLGTELEWIPERGPVARMQVSSPTELKAPVVVIGDLVGGLEVLKNPEFAMTRQTRTGVDSYGLHPVYLQPERVPEHPRWLSGVPMVVLSEGAERMSVEQWKTLFGWLMEGGRLIVPAAHAGAALWQTPLKGLLPERAGAPRRMNLLWSRVELLTSAPYGPNEPVGIVPLRISAEHTWHASAEKEALVLSRRMGKGRLLTFAGDLFAPAWRGWHAYKQLWQILLLEIKVPDSAFPLFDPPNPPLPRRELPSLWWLGSLFALYWTVVVVVWRILRLKRMLVRAPFLLSLLVLLTSAFIAFSLPAPEGNRIYRQQRVYIGVNGMPMFLEYGKGIYQIPAGGWQLDWEPGTSFAFVESAFGRLNGAIIISHGSTLLTEGEASSWCRIRLNTRRITTLGDGIELQGVWKQDSPQIISLVNRTGFTLKNVYLFSPAGWWRVASEVKDGEALASPQHRKHNPAVNTIPNTLQGVWLFAELEGMPSALKTPAPVEEGRARFYLALGAEGSL